jgi:hypoxanthine phosphoribosyltransferase
MTGGVGRSDKPIDVLYGDAEIAERNSVLAHDITQTIGQEFLVVAVLKGSFVFAADLVRALHNAGAHPQIDFMTLASYGSGTKSSGNVEVIRDVRESVVDRHILLIDDILESGRTLDYAKRLLLERGASSVRVCVLLDKPGKRAADINAEFVGFVCPDKFVIGYGLDYANYYRELPYIGILRQD